MWPRNPTNLPLSCLPSMWQRFPKLRTGFAWLGLLFFLFVLVSIPLIRYSKAWLTTEIPLQQADWIIVLGGESGQRVFGAAELYHAGVAPNVFVSGEGDCRLIVRRLVMAGVPRDHIGYECGSRNTAENALFSKQALSDTQPHRIMLVTSWYHSHRAYEQFRRTWPEVEWGIHSVHAGDSLYKTLAIYEAGAVVSEYIKILWYALRYSNQTT